MGSTLGQLKIGINNVLSVAEQALMTDSKRTDAVNFGIRQVLMRYEPVEYVNNTTLSLVSGVANAPLTMLRPLKLYTSTDVDGYLLVPQDDFDHEVSNTYTIIWNSVAGQKDIHIYPADTTSMLFRYVYHSSLSDDTDTVRFDPYWDKAICTYAAAHLLKNARRLDMAQAHMKDAEIEASEAWNISRSQYSSNENNRLQSRFEREPILRSRWRNPNG